MPMGLRFITENPVTKSYREAQEFTQAERLREQNLKSGQQQYDIREERRAPELRRTLSDADISESTARVATGTEGSKIATAGNEARRSGTMADSAEFQYGEDQATAPDRRRSITAGADQARTTADSAALRLREDTELAPTRRRQAEASATSAETNARRGQVELSDYEKNHTFMATLDLLAKGDIAGAQAYAERNRLPIPAEVLNNANMMQAIKNLSEMAKQRFPNRPNDQAEWMKIQLKAMTDELGRVQYSPGQMISSGEGPRPPEQAFGLGRPRSGSPAADNMESMSVEDNRLLIRLEAANKRPDPANPFAPATLDTEAVAANLIRMGRPDLAQLYNPNAAPPQPQPRPAPTAQPQVPQPQPMRPSVAPPAAPPQAAVDYLRQNPQLRMQFDQKYGQGASARVLGQ